MKKLFLRKPFTFTITMILVCIPLYSSFSSKAARAALPVFDAPNYVQNTITAGNTTVQTGLDTDKFVMDTVLKKVAWGLGNKLIEGMLQSTIDWVNSGFEGKPTFVQDFRAFALDIGDQYALRFIWDDNLIDLCSPFKLNVQLALEARYDRSREYYAGCRLSAAIGNIKNLESFHNGDFIAGGGWGAWYDVSNNPQLSADGAFFEAGAAMDAGIRNARGQSLFEVNLGDGFLSKKTCNPPGSQNCITETPGVVIQGYLENTLNVPAGRLTIADDFNELLGALINQLAGSVLGGAGGLLGSSSGGSSNSASQYFSSVGSSPTQDSGGIELDMSIRQQNATLQQTTLAQQNALTMEYLGLLNTATQLLQSCTGPIPSNRENTFNAYISNTAVETNAVLSRTKIVNSTDSVFYRSTTLKTLQDFIRDLPDSSKCSI